MRTLKFIINNQTLQKSPECDFSGLVAGSIGYLRAAFKFSDDWNGYLKVAVFSDKRMSIPYQYTITHATCRLRYWMHRHLSCV